MIFPTSQEKNREIDFVQLQDHLGPEIFGILWLTEEDLKSHPRLFNAMDYFMDGLISTNLKNSPSKIDQFKNFFLNSHFDSPFFIGHIKANPAHNKKYILDFMALINTLQSKKRRILIISLASAEHFNRKKISKLLEDKNPEYHFQTVIFR